MRSCTVPVGPTALLCVLIVAITDTFPPTLDAGTPDTVVVVGALVIVIGTVGDVLAV
jgi:hypothetical protein